MKDLTLPTPALPPTIQGGAITDPEDKAFFAFWYGHMLNDLMQPPLSNVDHATARYIWNHARAALSSHHEDGGRAATDKDSLTVAPVVALGGEPPCNPHPDAPHGYNRNASHNAGRYVCDCEGWAALGGEKGEAVAHGSGSPLDGLADKYGTRWGAPDEMGWSFEQHAFGDFCAEFAASIRLGQPAKRRLNETELFAMLMGCTEHPPKRLPDGYIAFARAIESYYSIQDATAQIAPATPAGSTKLQDLICRYGDCRACGDTYNTTVHQYAAKKAITEVFEALQGLLDGIHAGRFVPDSPRSDGLCRQLIEAGEAALEGGK